MGDEALWDVLREVRGHSKAGRAGVVVFDLDSTLFDTGPRHHAILEAFSASHGDPALAAVVAELGPGDMGWNATDALAARGLVDPALHKAYLKFWESRFFDGDWLVHDRLYPGALDYVREVHDHGGLVYYLTGRDAPGMGLGTVAALRRTGLPWGGPRVVTHLKATPTLSDRAHKADAAQEIGALGLPVVALFDNEPGLCNLYRASFPSARIFQLATVWSPGSPPLAPGVIPTDWRRA
jgi:hypothetical protein